MPINPAVCGGCVVNPCTGCKNSTPPVTWLGIISGVTLCPTSCFATGVSLSGITYLKVISGSINGTYCFTINAGSSPLTGGCQWKATLPSPVIVKAYFDSGCTNPYFGYDPIKIDTIYLSADSSGKLYIWANGKDSGIPASLFINAFAHLATIDPNCVAGTFNNDLSSCGAVNQGVGLPAPDSYITVATGGSISLIPNGC